MKMSMTKDETMAIILYLIDENCRWTEEQKISYESSYVIAKSMVNGCCTQQIRFEGTDFPHSRYPMFVCKQAIREALEYVDELKRRISNGFSIDATEYLLSYSYERLSCIG